MDQLRDPLLVLGLLCLLVFMAEWLAERTLCRHLGAALLVIVLGAIAGNLGVIPTSSNAPELYIGIFTYLAPMAIFFLLLDVNLRNFKRASLPMIGLFLVGALGTVIGVIVAAQVVGGFQAFGPKSHALFGMYAGTYIGGSINFNAVALEYQVQNEPDLFAGAVAADNIVTTLWMVATLMIPQILQRFFPRAQAQGEVAEPIHLDGETQTLNPMNAGILLAIAALSVWGSNVLAAWLESQGWNIPSLMLVTTFGLIFAQFKYFHELPGSNMLGMFCVYLFLAVIGSFCELKALSGIGPLGLKLLIFALSMVVVHGLLVFSIAALFRQDWSLAAVASICNIGGPDTGLALARSLGRPDLVVHALLAGSLGNALGSYLGFSLARFLAGT